MSIYKGKTTLVDKPIGELYSRLSDFNNLKPALDMIPAEQKSQLGDITFSDGALNVPTPVGNISFGVIETEAPVKVVYGALASPVPFRIEVDLREVTPASTDVTATIDIELPMIVRTMMGSKIQEGADKFGDMIALFCK